MSVMARKRPSSRERILDAAAELVREVGAGRLTLDAVAERAGLSKGGLLYNFPTKEALLQGMLERIVEVLSSLEMHDLSPLTKSDRETVIAAIRRLLERGIR